MGSFVGGVLFAYSYRQSGTILSSWIKHSFYEILYKELLFCNKSLK